MWRFLRSDSTSSPSPQKSKHKVDIADPNLPANFTSRTLSGRNTLLGPLIEATFTCVAALSNHKAITCTDKGDVCILDDNEGTQRLYTAMKVEYGIKCLTVDHSREFVWIGGDKGEVERFSYNALSFTERLEREEGLSPLAVPDVLPEASVPISLGIVRDRLLSIDSGRNLQIHYRFEDKDSFNASKCFRAHSSAVLGVNILRDLDSKPTGFISWDINGLVIFWTLAGEFSADQKIQLEQAPPSEEIEPNELRVVRVTVGCGFFVSGDRHGILRSALSCVYRKLLT